MQNKREDISGYWKVR